MLLRMGECGLGGEEAFVEGVGALLGCLSALLTLPVGATRREQVRSVGESVGELSQARG